MSRLNSCDPFLKQIVSKQKVASVRLALLTKYYFDNGLNVIIWTIDF